MTVSRLLRELGDIYQPAEKFDEVFDMDIRNCLAHGSYWFENKEMHLASDPHLKNIRIMPLEDFMKAAMKTNVSAIAFVEALDSEMNKGTFRG
jgi:hypothetical protein